MFKKCFGCEFRHPACHDTCPYGYLEEKAAYEEVKHAKRLDGEYNACARELSIERKSKWQKRK